jgi:hypothetical protein
MMFNLLKVIIMFTSIIIYYLGSALTLWGTAEVLYHVPDKRQPMSDDDVRSLGGDTAPDGEKYGTPYGL